MTKAAQKQTEVPEAPKAPEADDTPEITDEQPVLELVKATPVVMSRTGLEVEHNTTLRINVPPGVTPEQCMDEAFYAHVANRITIGDTLILRPDTMEWELVLHVADTGREFVHVIKKAYYDLSADRVVRAAASRYSIDFAGTTDKYRVLLDGNVLKKGLATKALAIRACENHQLAVDRSVKKQ